MEPLVPPACALQKEAFKMKELEKALAQAKAEG